MSQMRRMGKCARAFCVALCLVAVPVCAVSADYRLRTDPSPPRAGQEFDVVAEGNACELLFVGNPFGDGRYDDLTLLPGVIRAQVGYYAASFPECENLPHEARVAVPPMPAGNYRLELYGRFLFTEHVGELQATDIVVVAAGVPTRVVRVPASGWASRLACVVCAVLIGLARWRT